MTQLLAQSSVHCEPLSVLLQHTEAKKIEGRSQRLLVIIVTGLRLEAEINHPGFVRMQFQAVLAQSLFQHPHDALRIIFVREYHDKVIREANQRARTAKARLHLSS